LAQHYNIPTGRYNIPTDHYSISTEAPFSIIVFRPTIITYRLRGLNHYSIPTECYNIPTEIAPRYSIPTAEENQKGHSSLETAFFFNSIIVFRPY